MKNIFKIATALILITSYSCQDAIDIDQPGRLPAEEAFQTVDDLRLGLLGAYAQMDLSSEIQFNAVFTDEVSIGFDNGGQGLGDGTWGFVLNPVSAAPTNLWIDTYALANSANRILEGAELITPEPSEQVLYNNIIGQAYAIRAWAHATLLSYFTTDYADDNALGVILLDFVPGIDDVRSRNTNGEIYDFIESDLTLAQSLITSQDGVTFIGDDFVTALRARIAAYRGDYATAAPLAQSLLTKYPLANRANYLDMFADETDGEVIFKLERTDNDRYDGQGATGSAAAGGWAGANFAFVNATLDGSPYFEMGRSLFNLISVDDVRFDVNVDGSSIIDPDYANGEPAQDNDVLVIRKYAGSENIPLMNDLKIFRSSEMLLILAEARADDNDLVGAATLIKQLRDARFGTGQPLPVFSSQQGAFAAILDERRVELCFEGHRYKDLKRLGARAGKGIERDAVDCSLNGACNLAASDFRFTLPIPQTELAANSIIEQNPGY